MLICRKCVAFVLVDMYSCHRDDIRHITACYRVSEVIFKIVLVLEMYVLYMQLDSGRKTDYLLQSEISNADYQSECE